MRVEDGTGTFAGDLLACTRNESISMRTLKILVREKELIISAQLEALETEKIKRKRELESRRDLLRKFIAADARADRLDEKNNDLIVRLEEARAEAESQRSLRQTADGKLVYAVWLLECLIGAIQRLYQKFAGRQSGWMLPLQQVREFCRQVRVDDFWRDGIESLHERRGSQVAHLRRLPTLKGCNSRSGVDY